VNTEYGTNPVQMEFIQKITSIEPFVFAEFKDLTEDQKDIKLMFYDFINGLLMDEINKSTKEVLTTKFENYVNTKNVPEIEKTEPGTSTGIPKIGQTD
jgi:hypothetical protein